MVFHASIRREYTMTSYENDIMPLVCFVVSASDNLRGRPKNGATVSQLILYKY